MLGLTAPPTNVFIFPFHFICISDSGVAHAGILTQLNMEHKLVMQHFGQALENTIHENIPSGSQQQATEGIIYL